MISMGQFEMVVAEAVKTAEAYNATKKGSTDAYIQTAQVLYSRFCGLLEALELLNDNFEFDIKWYRDKDEHKIYIDRIDFPAIDRKYAVMF